MKNGDSPGAPLGGRKFIARAHGWSASVWRRGDGRVGIEFYEDDDESRAVYRGPLDLQHPERVITAVLDARPDAQPEEINALLREVLQAGRAGGLALDESDHSSELNQQNPPGSGMQKPGKKPKEKNEPRLTQAQVLVSLAGDAECFSDPLGREYATVEIDGHRETYSMRQSAFRLWLVRQYYETAGKPPGHQSIEEALAVLRGRATFEGSIESVFVRVGAADGATYLDLGGPEWEAVKITPDGWEVVHEVPVRFRRPKGIGLLPYPARGGAVKQLQTFVNVTTGDDWILVESALVAYLSPTGPYPILTIGGEHGSAKTWLARLLRSVIDPATVLVRGCPRSERDLAITAVNSWVLAYDNISELSEWLSDALCRISTGGGFGTRTLYQDEDETIFDATRPIVVNGIGEIAQRGDFRDRAILLTLGAIPDDKRKTEAALLAEFSVVHPQILGGLLDVVSAAMRRLPEVRLKQMPRMADFAHLAAAAAPALGIKPEEFLCAYERNKNAAAATLVEYDLVGKAVREWIEMRGKPWSGTAAELLELLSTEDLKKRREWPTKPVVLSNALTRVTPALREVGIDVTRTTDTGAKRTRRITIAAVGKSSENSSESSDSSDAKSAQPAKPRQGKLFEDDAGSAEFRTTPDKFGAGRKSSGRPPDDSRTTAPFNSSDRTPPPHNRFLLRPDGSDELNELKPLFPTACDGPEPPGGPPGSSEAVALALWRSKHPMETWGRG